MRIIMKLRALWSRAAGGIREALGAGRLRAAWNRAGYYLCLALALSLIGGAAVWRRSQPPGVPMELRATPGAYLAMARATPAPTPTPRPLFRPLEGAILRPHEPDTARYTEALGAYTAHEGVDIEAQPGTAVRAAFAGEVTRAYVSSDWGYTVEISDGERTARYAGLLSLEAARPGDRIAEGQVLGAVGDYPCAESYLGPHLHFELWIGGAGADPEHHF